ncbi:amino acid adenylation domain-containing protein [Sorangium sp. So ce118]
MNGDVLGDLDRCATLPDLLRSRAEAQGDALAFRFLTTGDVDGGSEEWTYRDLHVRAMGIAASLQAAGRAGAGGPAERALLLYAPGLDFIAAFMGCVYAGVVAVPTYPPNPAQLDRTLPRLRAIARDAGARFVLSTALIGSMAEALRRQAPELAELRWIATDAIEPGAASAWRAPAISGETLAFLQYTSGSTGHPKGVMLSHANVLANERAILAGFEHDAGSSGVGWLPLFHDMGLIGKVLQPIFVGFPCTLMSPLSFLERPMRWLKAISRFRATTSGGPNFAYDLCARKATGEDLAGLDLRSWTVAFNGAEPIRAETLDRFAATFAPCGFRREAFYPCYGLAEATLFVSGGLRAAPPACVAVDAAALARGVSLEVDPAAAGARRLVSSGAPRARVAIVSPERGERRADGEIGEIWVAGPSVAAGYWGRAEETARTFGARLPGDDATPYLRTGDLGFLSGGELFVTGRIKDLIVIRGRNLYPDDIERTVEAAHPRVRPGCSAAFSVEIGGEERLGVAAELDARDGGAPPPDVVEALRSAVAREHDVQPHAVLLLRPRSIPKTSSGKIQRHACAQGFRDGTLEALAVSVAAEAPAGAERAGAERERAAADPARVLRLALRAVPASGRAGLLVEVAREELARLARVDLGSLAPSSKLMALGLDSLASVELQARFEELLGVALPAQLLWQAATVEELAAALARALDAPAPEPTAVSSAAAGEPLELSSHQLRLWFFCRFAPESPLYHVVFGARIVGALDEGKLEESLAAVVRRHPALRTVFREVAGEPRQIVLPEMAVPLARARVEGAGAEEREERLRALAAAWGQRPFALEEGPLLRVCLVSLAERHHVLLFAQHHLVTDGRSIEVLVRDLAAIYAARASGSDGAPPGPPLGYADYARAQRAALARMDEDRAYWKAKLEGLPRLDLGAERRRPAAAPFAGGTVRFSLPAPHVDAALAAARAENATLFVALASVYAALLHRYTGQEDLGIGVVVANRSRPEHQEIVGFFANTVVLRVDLGGRPTYRELVRRVRRTMAEAMDHAELPYDEIARAAGARRDGDRDALLQASFVLESASEPPADVDGALWRPVLWAPDGAVEGTAKFDLGLSVARLHGELVAALEYREDRFARGEIERMTGHLGVLLRSAAEEPDRPIDELPLLSPEEERHVLAGCNDTAAPVPGGVCFQDLFRQQASRTPAQIAVACGEQRLTYAELDRASDRVAQALSARGVGPDRLVALLTRRDLDFIVLALGALKAAGAYVPLDPAHPARRNADILARAGGPPLLVGAAVPDALRDEIAAASPAAPEALSTGELLAAAPEAPGAAPARARPEHLAYVIFTSGSTGAPKGAMVEHRGMLNHLFAKVRSLGLGPSDVVAQTAPISFDISVWQLLSALLAGGACRLVPDEIATDPVRLLDAVGDLGITVLEVVPSLLRGALDELGSRPSWRPRLDGLRWLILTGEALAPDLARRWLALYPAIPLMNAYGPTECSDDVAQHVLAEPPPEDAAYVPIGRPIQNTQLHVLDRRRQPVPIGVAGELYVGGDGVGRGYLHDPARTAAAFLPDPFARAAGARLYRTGDLVRRLPGGELVFLGRIDHQIKLRGFRIELGEIESVIARCAGILDVVVVARADAPGDPRLVAYVVPEAPSFEPSALKEQLSSRLPGYMVPAAIVPLDALPLSANGKVDRKALPAPAWTAWTTPAEPAARTAPRTGLEQAIGEVWCAVLGLEVVGVHDDFFALGGHSLSATRAAARLRDVLGVDVAVRALFEAPTVARLAAHIERSTRGGARPAPRPLAPAPRDAEMPLSFAQQRLWFLDQLEPESATYNVPAALRLRGALDPRALSRAIAAVVRRHEVLRATLHAVDGRPVQRFGAAPDAWPLPLVDLAELPAPAREASLQRRASEEASRPFDLEEGPLLRASLFRLAPDEHALLITLHHIASDGWSLGVLARELTAAYEALAREEEPPLRPLPVQYADYAVWQRQELTPEVLQAEREIWRQRLDGAPPIALPTDRPRPAARSSRGRTHRFALPRDLAAALRRRSQELGATLFMTLLAAFEALLHRHSGQEDFCVGTPVAGRGRTELEPLIGLFVNTLVLRARLDGDPTFEELVGRVKADALEAYAHQDLPFELVVDALAVERDLSRNPLFQVMFALQNVPPPALALPGVEVSPVELDMEQARFDLTLFLTESGEAIDGAIEFDLDLFDPATIARLAGHYETILRAVAADPAGRVGDLPLLGREERDLVLRTFSAGGAAHPAPEPACAHRLFEARASEAPERAALLFEGASMSYGELNRRANQLAHHLRARGVRRGALVGVCLPRSPNMIVALLAVLKAGGAYVPLDPTYPRDRLAFMIEDARPALLVAQAELLPALPAALPPVVRLTESEPAFPHERADDPDAGALPEDLAYVIYTSGSTGRPKGVLIEHRSLSAFAEAQRRLLGVEPGTRVLQFTRLSFDVSVMEIFVPLLAGGVVCLARAEALMPGPGLVDLLRRQRIQLAMLTPSALMAVPFDALPDLRVLCVAGEVCPAELPRRWAKGRRFLNGYGPTEATVLATAAEYAPDVARPTIGRPLPNTQVYVLDALGQPAPIGVPGELHIGGVGLARGYLNRDDLTASRFVRATFPEARGARLYRTGDLVRWLPSGEIDFLGRLDEQVKIRGFRVELGEIETVLASHPDVAEAAVVTREHAPGDVRLAAFFIPRGGRAEPGALRRFLSDRLPDYMVPPALTPVERWPQTPSGKIDRRALAASAPAALAGRVEGARVAPRTRAELELCALFEELLGAPGVGVTDDFFALGGHSLLAVRLMAEIRGRFGRELPLTSLFRAPTAEGLAALLRAEPGAPRGRASVVVPLHAGGARAPLFFVHPVGGNVLCYADLARAVGQDRPFYGIQSFGLETPPRALGSVGEMAEAYCEELRRVQPEGPYLLGGWSMGGVVAFEMARVLERSARRVAAVVMLDAYLPPFDEPGDELPPIAQLAGDLAGISGAAAAAELAGLGAGADHPAWLLDRALELGALPRGTTLGELEALLDVFQRNAALLARYAPGAVQARVELFRAEGSPRRDPRPAWARWAPALRSHVARGDHYTLLRRPHVEALAERVRAALLEADGGPPPGGAGAAPPPR